MQAKADESRTAKSITTNERKPKEFDWPRAGWKMRWGGE